ncbi:long-chain-fatty-acid--CoA ligase [Sphingobium sp. BYY-5]|uniref:long-chain-fatty-acid--CoA ligase n=1 Tax=Sphingobium sp. BYY-5 TaxID=2926400 RepID=UPI001FA6B574|nr:long-chain-fatty-acid--CoA ligase [Sphingobium sp. BYY-5]MCI4592060.1 long-chain-fatty-acid--CoA ligase [Sphingobium sp. BYY-5]
MSSPKILSTPAGAAYSYPLLLRHLLANVADQSTAEIVSGDLRLSYAGLVDRVTRLATLLAQRGVRPGDTVAVMDWDSHRYLECYFAIPMMGAVLQTVNVRLAPAQIAFTLRQSGASFLLHHADFAPICTELLPGLPQLCGTIVMEGETAPENYETLIATTQPDFTFVDFDENAIATTFHTTGTTGDPKQVFFSHRQLVLHTLALSSALANQPTGEGLRRSDVYMPMTPMFHVHAWGIPYVATMLGVKQVYPGRYDPATLLMLKRREGVTFSHCVPTILRMLLDANGASGDSLKPWTIVIGGSALPPALAQEAQRAGIATLVGFGMSETGPVISLARSVDDNKTGLCRAGFPIPLVYTRTEGDAGGELVLRAPWLTMGHADQSASDDLWAGGWLHTGDVAEIDADGALRIVDRLKDVIKTGGEWVSSIEIENILVEQPTVSEAAVIGVPDQKWGERPVAFVVAAAGATPLATEHLRDRLEQYVATGRLSRYAVPEKFILVDGLPHTSVGKVNKKALRTLLEEQA